jgi:hypothetical protein
MNLISFDNVSSMSIRGKSTVNGSSFINSDVIFAVVIFQKFLHFLQEVVFILLIITIGCQFCRS